MSSGFNLNIFNYSQGELEDLLSLTKPYQNGQVETSCLTLRNQLFRDHSKTAQDKVRINGFLEQVKTRLIKGYRPRSPNMPPREQLMPPSLGVDESSLLPDQYRPVEFAPTYPAIIPPKNLNPLKKRTIRQTLNIDSRFRENYYKTEATDLQITLPTKVKNATSMKLVALELPPCSIYPVSKHYGTNFFHVQLEGTWHLVKISNGRYTLERMVQAINNAFRDLNIFDSIQAGSNAESCLIYFNFKNTGSSYAARLGFNRDIDGNPDSTNLQLKLGWILGFTLGEYLNTGNPPEFLAESPYDGAGHKYLYLMVDDYNNNVNNYFVAAFNSSVLNRNILARIPQAGFNETAPVQSDINDLATSERNYFGPIDIQKLKIQLLDEYGRVVPLNGRDFSIALEFECVYN